MQFVNPAPHLPVSAHPNESDSVSLAPRLYAPAMPNLYDIFMPLTRIAFRHYFRDITISGLECVPKDRALILASNHPSAFIEPCILASFLPRRLHFMARGDIFIKPFFIKILNSLNIIPIYRFRDGFGKLKKNDASFAEAFRILGAEKGALHILVEGRTKQIKHLEPLQKGAARIAFGTKRLFPDQPMDILPVGITFGTPNTPRDSIMISFGEPISVDEYITQNPDDDRRGITALTRTLADGLRRQMVHIEQLEEEKPVEQFLELDRTIHYQSWAWRARRTRTALNAQQAVTERLASLTHEEMIKAKAEITAYTTSLKRHRMTDYAVASNGHLPISTALLLVFCAPLYAVGVAFSIWPVLLGDAIAQKRVKQREFQASVRLALYLVLSLIYLLILTPTAAFLFGPIGILIPTALVLSALPVLYFRDMLVRAIEVFRFRSLSRAARHELRTFRNACLAYLHQD